jgi:hypothetical protein
MVRLGPKYLSRDVRSTGFCCVCARVCVCACACHGFCGAPCYECVDMYLYVCFYSYLYSPLLSLFLSTLMVHVRPAVLLSSLPAALHSLRRRACEGAPCGSLTRSGGQPQRMKSRDSSTGTRGRRRRRTRRRPGPRSSTACFESPRPVSSTKFIFFRTIPGDYLEEEEVR